MSAESRRALRTDIVVTLALLVMVVVAAELAFRSVLPNLSANSRTLAVAPERAASIAEANAAGETTVLVLGNSISGEGIDPVLLADRMAEAGTPTRLEHQPADTTVVRDWYYELKNLFVEEGAVPDVLVLPVGDAAPLTRVNARTEDLMFSFLDWSDLPDFMRRSGVDGFEDACSVVLGKLSALSGFRGRFQKRVLVALAGRYEELRLAMRDAGEATSGEDEVFAERQWAELMDDLAEENGMDVVVVAMPTNVIEGRLPADARAFAGELGWGVLEPGADAEWTPEDRPDGLHLEPDARRRFTELLAPALADHVAASAAGE